MPRYIRYSDADGNWGPPMRVPEPLLTPDELRLVKAALQQYLRWLRDLESIPTGTPVTTGFALSIDRDQARAALELIDRELNKE